MLDFFRRYQKYFFIVITIVIIISFSFFGTYSTLSNDYPHEQTVFTAVNGTDIKRQELDDLAMFISTDSQDKLILGGMWGPNFLNDGVIRKDFLETGMGFMLAMSYPEELLQDLKPRSEKEKRFTLYSHPQASYLNVESAWSYFAPDMKYNYQLVRYATNPVDAEAMGGRISLYLQERQFPAPLLKQVLYYQQKQQSMPDPSLDQQDLSLFGYHTFEDWFGPRYVRLIAQFIMNSAKIAEQKGYKVTKEEALADLMKQVNASYQQNMNNPNLGVANQQQYFDEQLRRMNMDQNKAIKVWRDVLLFRRLFNDVGNAVIVDPFSVEKIHSYAKEGVIGQLYELPKDLRFDNYRSLQKLETYLNAVSKRNQDEKGLLILPSTYLPVDEVAKKFPELIQHRYVLEVAQVNKNDLQTKVGIKETWQWEVDDKNWAVLKKKFPELGSKKSSTREERFAILESLNEKTRSQVDAFAREAITDTHPEWIDQALENASSSKGTIAILEKGGKVSFAKTDNRKEIIQLLNSASLKDETPNESAQKLQQYSPDQKVFYRIVVIKRAPEREIVTFAEANEHGILDQLLDKELEAHYTKIRSTDASKYQKADGSWKPLVEVRDQVADLYFEKIRKAVEKDYIKAIAPQKPPTAFLGDYLASIRLYAYMRDARDSLAKNAVEHQKWILSQSDESTELNPRVSLEDQWKLIQTSYQASRSDLNRDLNAQEIFALSPGAWSPVNTPGSGDLNFFHMEKRGISNNAAVMQKVGQLYHAASADAQRMYMQTLLKEFRDKKALSLDYMNKVREEY